MNLTPWRKKDKNPIVRADSGFPSLTQVRDEVDRLFDRFLEEPFGMLPAWAHSGNWMPAVDLSETDTHITVQAEVPGIDPRNIDVSVSGNILTLSGTKSESSERSERGVQYSERRFGSFRRRIDLPADVNADDVEAQHRNGVLTIRLKKVHTHRARRVQIKT
jgi:HSP20 family protein